MNKIFYQAAKLVKGLPLKYLINITGERMILPFYHIVSDDEVVHIKHLYKPKTKKDFEKELDFFLKYYTPIDLNTFISRLDNKNKTEDNCFLLSFDDGLREFYDVVAPILSRKGIPAVCFLNTEFIDNKNLFYRYKESLLIEKASTLNNVVQKDLLNWLQVKGLYKNNVENSILSIGYDQKNLLDEMAAIAGINFDEYLKKNKPYLDLKQIRQLIGQGYAFGAHSVDHPLYSDLKLEEQLRQTEESMEYICKTFDIGYRAFAFPFTDSGVSNNFFKKIYSGERPLDLSFGTAGLKKDSYNRNTQRIPIEIDNFSAEEIIYGEYLYYIAKSFIGKNKIKRD